MRPDLLVSISVFALLLTSCTAGRDTQNTRSPQAPTKPLSSTAAPIQITNANYEEVVRSQKVVLILFWAEWSAPDRAMMPAFDAVSKEYVGRGVVGKVNVDDNPELAQKFGIKGIPTLVVLKDGSEQERVVGLVPKKKINELLDKYLN